MDSHFIYLNVENVIMKMFFLISTSLCSCHLHQLIILQIPELYRALSTLPSRYTDKDLQRKQNSYGSSGVFKKFFNISFGGMDFQQRDRNLSDFIEDIFISVLDIKKSLKFGMT